MSPGRLDRFIERTPAKCPQCGGWDVGAVGFIHHTPTCPRNPDRFIACEICGLELLPGEKRYPARTVPAHLDCVNEYREHLEEEHA